jgi:hypothetical protein
MMDGNPISETYIRLKEFDQNIDTSLLAFALAHPANLRVLMFSIFEQMPGDVREALGVPNGGYGKPAEVRVENRGDIYIPKCYGSEAQWQSVEAAEKWIIEQLKKQGITLNTAVK